MTFKTMIITNGGACPNDYPKDSLAYAILMAYDPRNLPSCIVHVDAGVCSGLEQRDQFGWVVYKTWDYPLPDGAMFVSKPLGIDDAQMYDPADDAY